MLLQPQAVQLPRVQNCRLVGSQTVCSLNNTLVFAQLLLNLTASPGSRRPSRNSQRSRADEPPPEAIPLQKEAEDEHVDFVDDLTKFKDPVDEDRIAIGSTGGLSTASSRMSARTEPVTTAPRILASASTTASAPTAPGGRGPHPSSSRAAAPPVFVKGEKGDAGPRGPPGACPDLAACSRLADRDPTPATGAPGATGPKGDIGPQGPAGPKGERGPWGRAGERGEPGVCSADLCTGPQGATGAPGPAGAKGEPGAAAALDVTVLRGLVASELSQAVASLPSPPPGERGVKGEPGACGCGQARANSGGGNENPGQGQPQLLRRQGSSGQPGTAMLMNSASVRIMDTYKSFSDLSYALQDGALVFTTDERELFLKIDHQLNEWISVASYADKRPRRMPFPTSPAARSTRAPQVPIFRSHMISGPKLRLVALPTSMPGDLYYKSASSNLAGDYACQEAAQKAGLTRSYFKVFLNGMYSSLDTIVHRTQRTTVPIVNFHGQKLFDNYQDMLVDGIWNNRIQIQDFSGKDIADWTENIGRKEILAWQGVRRSQRFTEPFIPDCEGFSNRDRLKTGRATNLLSGSLFQSREITCDSRQVVLCIEAFDENSDISNPMDYRRK